MIVLLIVLLIVLFIILCITIKYMLRYIKNCLYFHPYKNHIFPIPDKDIKELFIPINSINSENKLHAWIYNNPDNDNILLFCQGNAGNISNRCHFMKDMIKCGISFIFFDYKGFGKSDGNTFMESIYDDSEICYNYIKDNYNIKNIIPIGESIGSYAASKLAKEKKLDKLILFAGMNSISHVVQKVFPFPLATWITKGDLDVGKNLEKYNGNTLILHSKEDEIVDYNNALLNYKICGENNAKIHDIIGTHNNLKLDWNVVKKFVDLI